MFSHCMPETLGEISISEIAARLFCHLSRTFSPICRWHAIRCQSTWCSRIRRHDGSETRLPTARTKIFLFLLLIDAMRSAQLVSSFEYLLSVVVLLFPCFSLSFVPLI